VRAGRRCERAALQTKVTAASNVLSGARSFSVVAVAATAAAATEVAVTGVENDDVARTQSIVRLSYGDQQSGRFKVGTQQYVHLRAYIRKKLVEDTNC